MATLTKEQRMVLHLAERGLALSPSLLPWSETELQTLDWEAVFTECNYQSITLASFDSLLPYKKYLPERVLSLWKASASRLLQNNLFVGLGQAHLAETLEKNAIPYVILKGACAAAYYPNPQVRALGDVDFYIDAQNRTQIAETLERNGYIRKEEWHVYHVGFERENVTFEMHFDLPGMPDGKLGEQLRTFFQPLLRDFVTKTDEGASYRAPNDIYHGGIILLHTLGHNVGYGVGLRHLCDWAAYVQRTAHESYWQQTLLPVFKRAGIYRYAQVITKMSATYLGIVCPDWAADVDEELCAQLLEDMFTTGNMGQKDKNYASSSQLIENKDGKQRGPIATLVHSLHKSILQRYTWVKKVWIAYPFIFVWKTVKNLFLMCIGKRSSISEMMPEAKKRKQIYEKLKIFEPQGEEK